MEFGMWNPPFDVPLLLERCIKSEHYRNEQVRPVSYIVQDSIDKGSLVDILYGIRAPFTEPIARYMFKQLLKLAKKIENHKDIFLDNIYIDSKFNIKLGETIPFRKYQNEGLKSKKDVKYKEVKF